MAGRRSNRAGAAVLLAVSLVVTGCGGAAAPSSPADSSSDDAATCVDVGGGTPVTTTAVAPSSPGDIATNPEPATGYRTGMVPVTTRSYAAATANPVATAAACHVLRDGGTAADAVVAAQLVLGLVEPQATGIGGGAFLLYYDAASNKVRAFDGRETAPGTATENYLRYADDTGADPAATGAPVPSARASGRSIGTPGVLRLLQQVHDDFGKAAFGDLAQPAIGLASDGFTISPRLAESIAESADQLKRDPAAAQLFLEPDGSPRPAGETLRNPALAATYRTVAEQGPDAFYRGPIAQAIVDASADTTGGITPGRLSLADLAGYRAVERDPLCSSYRDHELCGMPPPSSGGSTVAATLGILSSFDLAGLRPTRLDRDGGVPDPEGVHLIAEAERLAYADRDAYVADTDFVPLPGGSPAALLAPTYLAGRAATIKPDVSMGTAQPGDLGVATPQNLVAQPEHGTSHLTVADKYGNVAVMTTTVESSFGSFHLADGFVLNNQLTDFTANPTDAAGAPVVNRVQPGKRPRSSMAPTLVFDRDAAGNRGKLVMATGSPGGSVIIQFVVKTLVGLLDWGMDPQQAVSMVDFGAMNSPTTNVGGEHPNIDASDGGAHDPIVAALAKLGDQVLVAPQSSGLSALVRTQVDGSAGWIGGADPRREGVVLGDAVAPGG